MSDESQLPEDPQTMVIDESQLAALRHKAVEQHLLLGVLGGLLAGVIGAAIWAVITVMTGMQIGYLAIGVGFLVGFAIKTLGKGYTPIFGVLGAIIAGLACVLGNYFSVIGFISQNEGVAFMEILKEVNLTMAIDLMKDTFGFMDIVFYAIAIWAGWQYSFQHMTQEELNRL